MPKLRLTLLGEPNAQLDGVKLELGFRALLLLCLISLPRDEHQAHWSRSELAKWLWPMHKRPLSNLSQELYKLRNTLGQSAFDSDAQTLVLLLEHHSDLAEQQQHANSEIPEHWLLAWNALGSPLLAFLEPDWDQEFSLGFNEWLQTQRDQLETTRRDLGLRLAQHCLRRKNWDEASVFLETITQDAFAVPETVFLQRMLALTANTHSRQAEQVFQTLTSTLFEQNIQPATDLRVALELAQSHQVDAAQLWLNELFPPETERAEMPFVGRTTDLTALLRSVPSPLEGKAWAIVIEGEPGAGKTMLARALLEQLDPSGQRFLKAESFGELGTPAWRTFDRVVRQLVRRLARSIQDLPEETIASLARFVPDLLTAPSEELPEEEDRLLFAAIRALMTSADHPSLLFLDDLQWVDEASLGLLLELMHRPPARGFLLIATHRDTEPNNALHTRLFDLMTRERCGLRWALKPFDPNTVQELAQALDAPTADTTWMHAQTGGNPMYLNEMFKAGLVQPSKNSDTANLEQLIQRRLETLPADALNVLEACTVLGDGANLFEIKQTSNLDYEPTVAALAVLRQTKLLTQSETGIRFNHPITKETAFSRLSLERKQLLNLRAAQVRLDRPEMAAMHYWAAFNEGQIKPPTEELREVVEVFTRTATIHALRGNKQEGLTWFERSLAYTADSGLRVQTLTKRARVYERLLEYPDAERDLKHAETLSTAADPMTQVTVLNARGLLLANGLRDANNARQFAERALKILDKLEGRNTAMARADSLNTLGLAGWLENNLENAEHFHREALDVRRAFNDPERIQMSLQNLGNVLTLRNDPQAEALFNEAIGIAEKLGDVTNVARGYANLGYLMIRLEKFAEAEQLFEHALKIIEPIGEMVIAHAVRNNLGIVRFYQGKFAEARVAYLTAFDSPRIAQDKPFRTLFLNNVIESELRLGLYDEASEHLSVAFALMHDVQNRAIETDLYFYQGELQVLLGQISEAISSFHNALHAARDGYRKDREETILVRLAMLENNAGMAHEALRLIETATTRAALMAVSGNSEEAHQEILSHKDNFERARFLDDLTRLSGIPTYADMAKAILVALR
jgi:tetratricopeptide (TPR) repeat protein/DNA-binding SARP family transcriptional activator